MHPNLQASTDTVSDMHACIKLVRTLHEVALHNLVLKCLAVSSSCEDNPVAIMFLMAVGPCPDVWTVMDMHMCEML